MRNPLICKCERNSVRAYKACLLRLLPALLTSCSIPHGAVDSVDAGLWYKPYRSYMRGLESYSETDRKEEMRIFNEKANDPSVDRATRADVVFLLFSRYIRPGFTSADCRHVMGQSKWLDAMVVKIVGGVGGQIPVDWPMGSTLFSMAVFPDTNGYSDWYIWFTLSGLEISGVPWVERTKKAREFFKGDLAGRRVRLHEFALVSPSKHLRTEVRFSNRGVGLDFP